MVHTELIKIFKDIFHVSDDKVECWFPNGKNSVRVRMKNCIELIFTYYKKDNWRVETVKSFIDNRLR